MRNTKKHTCRHLGIGLLLSIAFGISGIPTLSGQSYYEAPILDTVEIQGKQVLIFENNTWDFLIDQLAFALDKAMSDTMALFTEHWDNNTTFPYRPVAGSKASDTVLLILQDSVRQFVMPYYNRLNSGFGWRGRRVHNGIDIMLVKGTPVKAAFDGKVRYAQTNNGGYGKLVIIRHFNGLETYYGHLDQLYVKPDQMVKAGQVIGTGGNTGATWTGDHLHFEMRYHDKPFNPFHAIDFDQQKLKSDSLLLTPESFKVTTTHKGTQIKGGYTDRTAGAKYHVVKKGETLSHIAVKYHTSVDKLLRLNHLKRTSVLQIGQKIRVR